MTTYANAERSGAKVRATRTAMLSASVKSTVVGLVCLIYLGVMATLRPAWADPATDQAAAALLPQPGEIRLDGTVKFLDMVHNTMLLSATSFTLPGGRTQLLAASKDKTLSLNERTLLHIRGDVTKKVVLNDLKAGVFVIAVGQDAGSGKALPAREIAVWDSLQAGVYGLAQDTTEKLAPKPVVPNSAAPASPPTQTAPSPAISVAAPDNAVLDVEVGHTGGVSDIAFSPDNTLVATASGDMTVRLWDVTSGALLRTLKGHHNAVAQITFAPDGTLASAGEDGIVNVWNPQTGALLRALNHGVAVKSLAFSPDGKLLVSGGWEWNPVIKVWDAKTGALLHTIQWHKHSVESLSFSPDGSLLACGSADATITIWDTQAFKLLRTLTEHTVMVRAVAFAPDGKTFVSGDNNGVMKFWDTQTWQVRRTVENPWRALLRLAFSPDGKFVAATHGVVLRVWNAQTGAVAQEFASPHEAAVDAVAFSPDGQTFAIGAGNQVRLFDPGEKEPRAVLAGTFPLFSVALSSDGKNIAAASWDGTAKLWDLKTGVLVNNLNGQAARVGYATFSTRKPILATGSGDGIIKIWYLPQLLAPAEEDNAATAGGATWTMADKPIEMHAIALSPDGQWLASGYVNGTITLWDARTFKLSRTLPKIGGMVRSLAFSPDGQWLASADGSKTVNLWAVATGQQLTPIEVTAQETHGVVFAPDGKTLAVSVREGIRLVQLAGGAAVGQVAPPLPGVNDYVGGMAFSPDGTLLAAATNSLILWDVQSHAILASVPPNTMVDFSSVTFTQDGKTLITTGKDGMVRLWTRGANHTLRLLATMLPLPDDKNARPNPNATPNYITFTPEGYYISSPSGERFIHFLVNGQDVPAAQFKAKYNRPDLIQQSLAGETLQP